MLRIIFGLLFLTSCSLGTISNGGDRTYVYDAHKDYSFEDLAKLAPQVVRVSKRNPPVGQFDQLFDPKLGALKRVGIIVFETVIQPTRGGLAENNLIYLSAAGKQLLTEKMLSIWEQSFPMIGPDIKYISTKKIKNSKALHSYGSEVQDHIQSLHTQIDPDDIFYRPKGKLTTEYTTLSPRGMQDVSLMLVPAAELMMGPKWSEHQKHFVNDVSKELKLDAVIVVLSEINWTAEHVDKHSGEFIPEQMVLKIHASTLIPIKQYLSRLNQLKMNDERAVNICFGNYESEMKFPIKISVTENEQNFNTIEKEILLPMQKVYKDLAQMTIFSLTQDLRKTF
ncbi:MAG: hypothetical protein AB7I27_18535 [Bacteriovoracaceae bacterium]